MEENLIVYEAVKNTALHCEDGIRTARIYMYTVYFALLSFGFTYRGLILVSFFVLIVFQTYINNERVAIQRISSYIRVFFETKRNDMHWSLLNKDEDHLAAYRTQYLNIGWYIDIAGASLLAVVSFISMLIILFQSYGINELPLARWGELMIALILCGLVIFINSKTYVSGPRNADTIRIIDGSMKVFYDKCYTMSKGKMDRPDGNE